MRPYIRPVPFACLLVIGCSAGGTAPLAPPKYDPPGMAGAALKAFDKNGDGKLDGAEFDACPGLKAMLPGADKNADKALDNDELTARFAAYQAADLGATGVGGTVKWAGPGGGVGLAGATVTFTPEDCFGGTLVGGSGVTDENGVFTVSGVGGLPGLPCGAYRVTVSVQDAGKETVPARYNSATTLGAEVFSDRGSPNFLWVLGRQ